MRCCAGSVPFVFFGMLMLTRDHHDLISEYSRGCGMKIFNVIDTEKVARGLEELGRKAGLSMSSEDSREILCAVWKNVESLKPDRYLEARANDVMLFDLEAFIGKQYARYMMARKTYFNHILYAFNSRGCMGDFVKVFPPYVSFPEQAATIDHGEYTKVYHYYLSILDDAGLRAHFQEFPIPQGHGLQFLPEELLRKHST